MSGALSRRAAAELLMLTLDSRRTLDEAMVRSESFNALEGSDRGFARVMASATLRELGRIDAALSPLLSRPLEATSPAIRALLRVGAIQLWRLETHAHAAVSETVEAAKDWPDARSGGGFLNAVLRRAADMSAPLDDLPASEIWPNWLAARFEADLGANATRAFAAHQLNEPPIFLSAKTSAEDVAIATGGEVTDSGSVRLESAMIEALPGYEDGYWWVQDAAAALPAQLLNAGSGDAVIDLCAAPGGKTLQLAATGARVTAVDRSRPRLERLRENLQRTGLTADIIAANADEWRPQERASKLLLDAPCSALGTLRRHPEGAWIKREAEIDRFPTAQARLLVSAADMVSPGGTVIYCVCTPLKAEGFDIVARAILDGLYERFAITEAEIPGFEACLTPEGDLLTLPAPGAGHDAFYIARLKRL
ncbi:RsmB/NOP family class I SAM-dependent RNA methyltransferase [Hyphomonas pacifica]|uniref:RsmB/NOP family class I SAM-dependent RNA methyltransferase n=1 Tax=Hyphomonas pacifica TaxID=1280941 RepID=UPI000DD2E98D|nr:transcription antitermination factor NusB [Hyphomonas pacifica]